MTTTRKLTPFQIADRQRWAAFRLADRAKRLLLESDISDGEIRVRKLAAAFRAHRASIRCTAMARLTFRSA
jgi:hypothetical protein